jgi:hypothetical protein
MSELERLPERKSFAKTIFGNARIFVIALVFFTVIVVTTTDIRFVTIRSLADLGVDFFIFLFVSYGMYVCCVDGGVSAGYATKVYEESVERFTTLKNKIEDTMLTRMNDFCNYYCDEELRKMRMQYLSVVCIPYDVYLAKYVTLGKKEVNAIKDLKSREKKAIIKANAVRRIKITPERIMTLGKNVRTRSVLAVSPDTMKRIAMSKKMVRMLIISAFMTTIAFDMMAEPTWVVFAGCVLKLAAVAFQGYDGHREGFNNITSHTVDYINNQSMLMSQAIQYINPTKE